MDSTQTAALIGRLLSDVAAAAASPSSSSPSSLLPTLKALLDAAGTSSYKSQGQANLSILENVMVLDSSTDAVALAAKAYRSLSSSPPSDDILTLLVEKTSLDNLQARISAVKCLDVLCAEQDWQPALATPETRIIITLLDIVMKETHAVRYFASCALSRLSGHVRVKQFMNPTNIQIIIDAVTSDRDTNSADFDTRKILCQTLGRLGVEVKTSVLQSLLKDLQNTIESLIYLSKVPANARQLADPMLQLTTLLEKMLSADKLHASLLSKVGELAIRIKFAPTMGILNHLNRLCQKPSSPIDIRAAVWTLETFAIVDTNRQFMRAPGSGVNLTMQLIIADDAPTNDSRALACSVLAALHLPPDVNSLKSVLASVRAPMGLPGPHTLGQQPEKVQKEALSCLTSLARSHSGLSLQALVGPADSANIGRMLHQVASISSGGVLERACTAIGLLGLTIEPQLVELLATQICGPPHTLPESTSAALSLSNLLESFAVVRGIESSKDSTYSQALEKLQTFLFTCVSGGVFTPACEHVFCVLGKLNSRPTASTLGNILAILDSPTTLEVLKEDCLSGLRGFVRSAKAFNHQQSSSLGSTELVSVLLKLANTAGYGGKLTEASYRLLMLLASDKSNMTTLLLRGVHTTALEHLRKTNDPATIAKHEFTYPAIMIFNLCEWPEAREALVVAGALELFKTCYLHETAAGLYSSLILASLIGSDESGPYQHLLHSSPATILRLTDCLVNTTHRVGDGENYAYGIFALQQVTKVINTCVSSDANKRVFANARVIRTLAQILQDFTRKREKGKAGGGGDDVESVQNCIEILHNLSFVYADNDQGLSEETEDAKLRELMSGSDVIVELESLLQLQETSKTAISPQHALAASRLLERLSLKKKREPPQSTVSTSTTGAQPSPLHGKHIMLSYNHANKARVVELSKALKAAGYDTWRDEEGSSILGGVQGAMEDRMPEAVQQSSHVIICISRDYKQSANCRQEALYAKKLCEKKQLQQLLFVMLDEEYTQVDGWLGMLVKGNHVWYPLWNDKCVVETCAKLSAVIGPSPSAQLAAAAFIPPSPSTPSPAKEVKHREGREVSDKQSAERAAPTPTPPPPPPLSAAASSTPPPPSPASRSRSVLALSLSDEVPDESAPLPAPAPAPASASASALIAPISTLRMEAHSPMSPTPSMSSLPLSPMSPCAPFSAVSGLSGGDLSPAQQWTWSILSDPHAPLDPQAFHQTLSELGVNRPEDVEFLSNADRRRIEAGLKVAKRRAFSYSTVSMGTLELDRAWALLSDSFNAVDSTVMEALLAELGVSGPEDLSVCDEEDLMRIAAGLKKIKSRTFLSLVK